MAGTEGELTSVDAGQHPPRRFRRWRLTALLCGSMGLIAIGWNLRQARLEIARRAESSEAFDLDGAELQQHLSQCRSFSAAQDGSEPDWAKAESACQKALDQDPIHREANFLYKQVKLERQAFEDYVAARKTLEQLKPEDALERLAKIPAASSYRHKATLVAAQATEMIKKKAGEDCRKYFRAQRWSAALSACEKYMGLACRSSTQDPLGAPPGHTLKLAGPIRRGDWRSRDEVYRAFLQVRAKLHPRAGVWTCPESTGARQSGSGVDAHREVRSALQRRFNHPSMADALTSYWSGKTSEAIIVLQRVREDPQRTDLHAAADGLRKEIALVAHWFKAGESALQAEDPERAMEPFQQALQYDRKLMGDFAERYPSFYSRSIRRDMATHSYQRGRYWADRDDARRACRIWKLGAQFYRGNLQLLQALRYCTDKGRELLRSARRCAELTEALELAVPGDELNQKLEQKRAALRCP